LDKIEVLVTEQFADIRAGGPNDPATSIGPMVSLKQWQRVQRYIQIGIEEGAHLLVGGPGLPDGIDAG
jgi:aldehyde dehydrogenase (NAD+)